MPYKIVNISSMWDHVGKWNVLAWSALETGSDGVIFGFWPKQVFLAVSEGPWYQPKLNLCEEKIFTIADTPNHDYHHNYYHYDFNLHHNR